MDKEKIWKYVYYGGLFLLGVGTANDIIYFLSIGNIGLSLQFYIPAIVMIVVSTIVYHKYYKNRKHENLHKKS